MREISTLIYFVNNFQADLNDCENKVKKELSPSKHVIDNILDFARSYEVLKTESAGYTEMILN